MTYTPYDWQHTLTQKIDYVEDRLRLGNPVVGISSKDGVLILTLKKTQGKIYEIYDRLAFAGIGNPSDLENIRHSTVDFCHAEGFQRSAEDVTIQRVVGFAISPAIKKRFSDPFQSPLIIRGLFTQVGREPQDDLFYTLNYDGEFTPSPDAAVLAGTGNGIRWMELVLWGKSGRRKTKTAPKLETALEKAVRAWAIGNWATKSNEDALVVPSESVMPSDTELNKIAKETFKEAEIEAALMTRSKDKDRRLEFLSADDLKPYLP